MNIVGKKAFAICAVLLHISVYGQLSLHVKSSEGITLKQAAVGQPFLIQITAKNMGTSLADPEIEGLDNFAVQQRSQSIQIVNNRTSVTYEYTVIANQPGVYTIGPAMAQVHGKKEVSEAIELQVKEVQAVDKKEARKQNRQVRAFARLTSSVDSAVVGQKITYTLRFYSNHKRVQLKHVEPPKAIAGAHVSQAQEPAAGTENIDGVDYAYQEFVWDMYPTQPGLLVIPAHAFDYTIVKRQRADIFAMFFGSRTESKRGYSNALTIAIEPLPVYSEPVHAVGTFIDFTATLEPAVAKVGEAALLAITVTGKGDTEHILPPELQNIPDALKIYFSKKYSYLEQNIQKTCFEYVVQATEPGEWNIPEQNFTFFDVQTHSYKVLQTSTQLLTVLHSGAASDHIIEPQAIVSERQDTDRLQPLYVSGLWYAQSERYLPWKWFFIFCGLLFILWVLYLFRVRISNWYLCIFKQQIYKRAFSQAQKKVFLVENSKQYDQLYHIVLQLFADRKKMDIQIISSENIDEYIVQSEWSANDKKKWEQFFTQISEWVFFEKKQQLANDQGLCKRTLYWIERLKEVI